MTPIFIGLLLNEDMSRELHFSVVFHGSVHVYVVHQRNQEVQFFRKGKLSSTLKISNFHELELVKVWAKQVEQDMTLTYEVMKKTLQEVENEVSS